MEEGEREEQIKKDEIFAEEVQDQLKESPKQPIKQRLWSFLNSNFGLWLISTVVVGLIVYSYTNWKEFAEFRNEANRAVNKLDIEISARMLAFLKDDTSSSEELQKKIGEITKGMGATAIFPEFRNRGLISLLWELESLLSSKGEMEEISLAIGYLRDLTETKFVSNPEEFHQAISAVVVYRKQWSNDISRKLKLLRESKNLSEQGKFENRFQEKYQELTELLASSQVSEDIEHEGWIYLGEFVNSAWKTKYLNLSEDTKPKDLKDLKDQEVGTTLNVRRNPPNSLGRLAEVIDILKEGDKVDIFDVKEWHSTGYWWAKIKYD